MAKKDFSEDKIQLEVAINGSQPRKELAELAQAMVKLKGEQKDLIAQEEHLKALRKSARAAGDHKEVARLAGEIRALSTAQKELGGQLVDNKNKQDALRDSMQLSELSLTELRKKAQALRATWTAGVGDDEALRKNAAELAAVEKRLQLLGTAHGRALMAWETDRLAIDRNKWSLEQLRLEQERYQRILDTAEGDSQSKSNAAQRLEEITEEIRLQGTEAGRAEKNWAALRESMTLDQMSGDQLKMEAKHLQDFTGQMSLAEQTSSGLGPRLTKVRDLLRQMDSEAEKAAAAWRAMREQMAPEQMTGDQLKMEATELERLSGTMTLAEQQAAGLGPRLDKVRELLRLMNTEAGRAEAAWASMRESMTLEQMSSDQLKMEADHLQRMAGSMSEAERAAAGLDPRLAEVRERLRLLNTEAGQSENEWAKLRQSMHIDDMSIEQLKLEKQYLEGLRETLPRTSAEFEQLSSKLHKVDAALKESKDATALADKEWEKMRRTMSLTEMSMEELRQEIAFLERAKEKISPTKDAAAYDLYSKSLNRAKGQMKALESGMGPFARMWTEIRGNVLSAGAVLGGMFAGQAVISGLQNMVRSSAELSDAISDVKKTTGLSTPVVRELVKELSGIDTRTSRAELMALARDAGKLGISAKEDVMQFVRAGNQLNVALGEDLGQDAIKNIGKLVDLFKLKERFGLETSMLKVGSALNELGMASTASEGYMVDFLKRMGGIAPLAGITIQQTLALGATLDSLGQTSEVSSTALSKLFVKLGSDADKYAGLAGMSVEKFRMILKKNALEAFIAVLEGTKKTEGGVVSLAETLGDMGIDAARAAGIFGVLGQNTDLLRKQMNLANQAFAQGSSITEEYNEKNTNFAATLEKLQKQFLRLISNSTVIEWMTGFVDATKSAVDWIERNGRALAFLLKALVTVGATWAAFRLGVVLWTRIGALATAVTRGWAMAQALFSANTITAGRAMIFFNTAVKTNPLGLILGLLTAVAGAFSLLGDAIEAVAQDMARERTALQLMHLQILTNNKGQEGRLKLINQLKEQYPGLLKHINAETVNNKELAAAIQVVNQELINRAVLQKKDAELEEQASETAEYAIKRAETEIDLRNELARIAAEKRIPLPEGITDIAELTNTYLKSLERAGNTSASEVRGLILLRDYYLGQLERENEQASIGNEMAVKRNKILEQQNTQMEGLVEKTRMQGQGIRAINTSEIEGRIAAITAEIDQVDQVMAKPWLPGNNNLLGLEQRKAYLLQQRESLLGWSKEIIATEQMTQEQILKNVEYYNKLIEEERKKLDLQSTPSGYKKIEAEIKRLEKLRDRITGGEKSTKQAKAAEDLDKLLAEYQRFQDQLLADTKSADERELAELRIKHAKELEEVLAQQKKLIAAKKLSQTDADMDVTVLTGNQSKEEADMIERQGKERLDALAAYNARITSTLSEGNAQFLSEEEARVQQLYDLAQEKGESLVELERQMLVIRLRQYEQNALDALDAERERWDEIIEEAKKKLAEYDEAMAQDPNGPSDVDLAERKRLADAIVALEHGKNLAIESINKTRRQNEEAAERKHGLAMRMEWVRRLQQFSTLANGLNDLLQGVTQYQDAGIAAAESRADMDGERTEEELANIERLKKARREAALMAIYVQGAAAIANGVASALAAPNWVVGVAQALSTVGIVMGLMGQARALMNEADTKKDTNQNRRPTLGGLRDVPLGADGLAMKDGVVQMAKGGISNGGVTLTHDGTDGAMSSTRPISSDTGGGVLGGNYHTGGGNDVIDRKTGRVLANVEKDELMLVMSRKATAANADLLPSLFKASREGKRITPFDRNVPLPNPAKVSQAMRVVHMAEGGAMYRQRFTTFAQNGVAGNEANNDIVSLFNSGARSGTQTDSDEVLRAMLRTMESVRIATENFPKQLVARASVIDIDRRKAELEQIRDLSRGRKTA